MILTFRLLMTLASILLLGPPLSAQEQPTRAITIYAATSLTDAFEGLAAEFAATNPDAHIALNFSSSSKLAAQLLAGAPADIFASANSSQMDSVIEGGRVDANAAQEFARNQLVLILPADNPADIQTIKDLSLKPHLLVLAVTGTPIRDYTNAMLRSYSHDYGRDFHHRVLANLVSEESNVRQVVTRVALGEADAGIVYQTDVTPDVADKLRTLPIADQHNQLASYPIAIINDAADTELAQNFIAYALSQAGQSILRQYGFCSPLAPPDPTAPLDPSPPSQTPEPSPTAPEQTPVEARGCETP